ncbi:MAG: hypothetical protein ABF308_16185 [Phaeobacter gallaeciensis]
MSTMTFRARDNATALELVERRFGGDALILSTVYADGRVEITATDEMPPPANSDTEAVGTSKRRIDVLLDEAVPLTSADEATETTEEMALPAFRHRPAPRRFAEILEEAKQGSDPQEPSDPEIHGSAPAPAPLRAEILGAQRIVLVGPSGAGKTQVALQLALLRRAQSQEARTSFVFCGTGSKADGAVLAQKSHLLGMTTAFKNPADLEAPSTQGGEIVLLSGRVQDAVEEARGLLGAPGTKTLLVLPDGLRPERIARLGAQWREITTSVVFGHVEDADIPEAETALAAEDGLSLLWLSDPDALVDGLRPVGPDEMSAPVPPSSEAKTASSSGQSDGQVMFRSQKMKSEIQL